MIPYRTGLPAALLAVASLYLVACESSTTGPGVDPPDMGLSCQAAETVRVDGAPGSRTIAGALAEAPAGAAVLVAPGEYPPVLIDRDDVALCGDGGRIVIRPDSSYGIRITGRNVLVEGVEVRGVTLERFGVDHGPSGIVVAGQQVTVRHAVVANNGTNGILVTDAATAVLLEDVIAFDNTYAGIAIGGGTDIEIVRAELYSTGGEDAAETRRQGYGVATDNVGDTRLDGDRILDIDGIGPIAGLSIRDSEIRDHPGYGIRISAGNPELSDLESGRITTRGVELTGSHLYRNGSGLDDWVGGLYHHGNVLLQHIEGGLVAENRIEEGYTWGLDAYACNGITYRHNLFVYNDLGLETEGITIAPSGIEINGGRDNVFANNLVYGNGSGVFSSWIPDSGDAFDRPADEHDSWDGTYSLVLENNIIVGNRAIFTGPNGETEQLVDYMEIGPESFTRTFTNNVLASIPEWYGGPAPTGLTPTFEADNPHWDVAADQIFVDAGAGDFTIRSDSPIAGQGIGPASIQ